MKQKGPDYGKSTKTIQQFETSGCETLEMYNNIKKIFIIKLHIKQHENVINIFFRKKKKNVLLEYGKINVSYCCIAGLRSRIQTEQKWLTVFYL